MGVSAEIDIDIAIFPVGVENSLLLCSDGLTNMLSDNEIKEILKEPISVDLKVEKLVSLANERGGIDNITVLLADFATREEQ